MTISQGVTPETTRPDADGTVSETGSTCQECGSATASEQLFCRRAHKDAFYNRASKRGKVLMPLLLTWRAGRGGGAEAKYAFRQVCALADRWNTEDREAGRPPMARMVAGKMAAGWLACDLPRPDRGGQ